ncbi:hypothetical protein [Nannocystis punicea]|uniref:Uncharacterized protein n=1 Tax=Nannocystis punicea TaxID=2995304 RepID=A0ABY7HF84_9BACT|nr:hypothetical protein [Nannocystis poenicansa]WAS97699.1 hypothetical protein O0S08_16265 [Nannocystis poenicansa]
MHRRSALVSFALFACAPKPPADTDGDATSTSQGDGATSTSSPSPATTGTTADPTPTSTTATGTTELEPGTATGNSSETAPPEDLPLRIYVVEMRPSQASGLDGLESWQSDPFAEWCTDAGPCGGAPTLGEPRWFVDGEFADLDAIEIGSRVAVLVPYEHPGCALACGLQVTEVLDEVEGGAGAGNLPPDLPCGTAASNVWLALDFGVIVRDGMHRAALRLEDRCGASTEAWSATFEP